MTGHKFMPQLHLRQPATQLEHQDLLIVLVDYSQNAVTEFKNSNGQMI